MRHHVLLLKQKHALSKSSHAAVPAHLRLLAGANVAMVAGIPLPAAILVASAQKDNLHQIMFFQQSI